MKASNSVLPILYRAFPRTSAYYLARRFLKPSRRLVGIDVNSKQPFRLLVDDSELVAYVAGSGPLVISAHGWAGSGEQLAPLNALLVEAGFRVVSFDAPAHGSSPGKRSNAAQFARTIATLHRALGPTAAIVGHSLGGLAAAMCAEQIQPRAMALICPMPSFDFALDQFQNALRFGPALRERIARRIEQAANVKREQGRIEHGLLPEVPTLLIHDANDRIIPVSASRELKERFPHLDYWETEGLGHARLLGEIAVQQRIVDFLSQVIEAPRNSRSQELVANA